MHIVTSIFVVQNLAIAGNKHRNGIRQQQTARGHCTRAAVEPLMADPRVFQIHGVH
jgi:hypothetical protein